MQDLEGLSSSSRNQEIYSRLAKDRNIFLAEDVTKETESLALQLVEIASKMENNPSWILPYE